MYTPNLRRAGLILLLLGAISYSASTAWIKTRHYELLYAPVSLSGENTYTLRVQEEGTYNLYVRVWPRTEIEVEAEYSVSGGDDAARATRRFTPGDGTYIGNVHLTPGTRVLRLKAASAENLAQLQAVLEVDANYTIYRDAGTLYEQSLFLVGILAIAGTGLLLSSLHRKPSEASPKGVLIEPPDRAKRFPGYGKRLPLANFGYMAAVVFALLAAAMMVMTGAFRYRSSGLRVHLLKIGETPKIVVPWENPVVLRLVIDVKPPAGGKGSWEYGEEQLFINNEKVQENQLGVRLRAILSTRSDRTVYVMGSEVAVYGSIAHLIDVAHGAYASRVVLVTTERAQAERTAQIDNVR